MTTSNTSGSGYPGQAGLWATTSKYNESYFIVKQLLALVRTATIVQVVSCTNSGGLSPVGFVNVQPMVNMIDGLGNSSPHRNLVKLPYSRVQGGQSAVICDPCKGDLGVAIFADRDISAVKNSRKQANPGSRRRNNLADGIYLFGILNAAPVQYIRFVQDSDGNPTGMEIVDINGNKRVMNSDGITDTDKNGNTTVMDSDGIKINGVLFDRSQNVSGIDAFTTTGMTSLGGGSQAVKLADNSAATKVKAT